jgi:hypothetical protein
MEDAGRRWECEKCGRLLGICKNGFVCIEIRDYQYIVEGGRVLTYCPNPRCERHLNIISVRETAEKVSNN